MTEPLMSVDDVAARLGLHPRTVRRYIRDGELDAQKIGKSYRITASALQRLTGIADAGPRPARRHIEASNIIEIEGVSRDDAIRITNAVVAASNGQRADDPAFRVETMYDEARERLKVVCLGSLNSNIAMLRLIELYSGGA
ncbi:helix-turn-helix domain-containing protein [Henriciella litoralis]|uniref:helix-turn-helix domain-containing protein n=1 Tax=Henriciella litoralis TaxID=568102 RepID=UPI0009FC4A24|nr:helix-turn-helix domain-containing protein [Henriciella litoralis]